jgi:hypothetical protein
MEQNLKRFDIISMISRFFDIFYFFLKKILNFTNIIKNIL